MGGGAWRKAGPLFVRVSAGRNKGSGSSRTQSSRQMTFKTYKQELQIHQKRGSSVDCFSSRRQLFGLGPQEYIISGGEFTIQPLRLAARLAG